MGRLGTVNFISYFFLISGHFFYTKNFRTSPQLSHVRMWGTGPTPSRLERSGTCPKCLFIKKIKSTQKVLKCKKIRIKINSPPSFPCGKVGDRFLTFLCGMVGDQLVFPFFSISRNFELIWFLFTKTFITSPWPVIFFYILRFFFIILSIKKLNQLKMS